MLIDGGGLPEDRFDIGKNVIAPFLWNKKIRRIDYLVLTHPDPDHFKGLNFIAAHFSIGQFWESGLRSDSEFYSGLEKTLLKKEVKTFSLNEKTPCKIINGVQLSFFNPPGKVELDRIGRMTSFFNNHSLVMKLQFKNMKVLLAGDIEKEVEYRLMREGYSLRADILKVPHHGSSSSSTPYFLQRVNPNDAILSVGERNIGRLPHPEVLKRYEELGIKIFRTDRHGAIRVITDGDSVKIIPFIKNNP
jgi:competence protein ComEC